ncbi:MAG: response regulator [Candidatus Acidiferrales bacterium]
MSDAAAEAARTLGADAPSDTPLKNAAAPVLERRRRRRARISAPVRVRSLDVTESGPDEISTTIDISPKGLLFIAANPYFQVDMDVAVTFPYCKAPGAMQAEQDGRVARVSEMPDGRLLVAIAIGAGVGEDLVDACGRRLDTESARVSYSEDLGSKRPLVLAVDADDVVRETMKAYLSNEGYDVIAVGKGSEAREVLKKFTPALLIAEVEGEGLPGFDLCAQVKSDDKLKHIHVLLTTRSGNPSDYSNAHSLGAVVCMAKPYKQDRLGHVVRLLAPPPHLCAQKTPAPHAADPSRRTFNGNGAKSTSSTPGNGSRRFRFPSFRS